MFEGVYSVPDGVSYNSYLLCDEMTVLFDTVDKAVRQKFMENLTEALANRKLDFLVVQHMEPDHSAVLRELMNMYPEMKIVCNNKTLDFIKQFFNLDLEERAYVVEEGSTLNTGKHKLNFYMAPMVHWPEVMVTYDTADKILFSADAFGCFGALNGALFADEVDFAKDYMDEARRYYSNIVGKYGSQVAGLLDKMSGLKVEMICPLHGFVWRNNIGDLVSKYTNWSRYEPEETGVMIAYASVYGNTENAAEILSCRLRDRGVKTVMFDVSVTPASDIVSAAFRWSHLVFASTTYNAGIFVTMEALINDLIAHNIQNRTVAVIENGSWAPASGGLISEKLKECNNIKLIEKMISIESSLKPSQLSQIDEMMDQLIAEGNLGTVGPVCGVATMPEKNMAKASVIQNNQAAENAIDMKTMFKLSYGLFVLTAKDGAKDNGCIINTVIQITEKPLRVTVAVNKANLTHDMILKTGEFNISILTENAPFSIFERFGFHSGKDTDKFAGDTGNARTTNDIRYLPEHTNGIISAMVKDSYDYSTHTLFIADVTQAFMLSDEQSITYQYYFTHTKPKPQLPKEKKKGFVCKICGYVHEGETLPDDFICPLCKHGAADFEAL